MGLEDRMLGCLYWMQFYHASRCTTTQSDIERRSCDILMDIVDTTDILAGRLMQLAIAFGFGAVVHERYATYQVFSWVLLVMLACSGTKLLLFLRRKIQALRKNNNPTP